MEVSSCLILASHRNEGYHEMNPYAEGMPNKRIKPKEGYPEVPCEFYMQDEGKCRLRHFWPRYAEIDYGLCKLINPPILTIAKTYKPRLTI